MAQSDVISRLEAFIECECTTPRQVANVAGLDPSNFAKMLSGQQTITTATLKKIAVAHGVNLEWLQTGNGKMMADTPNNNENSIVNSHVHNATVNGGTTIDKLIDLLQAKDRQIETLQNQISTLLNIINNGNKQ